MKMRTMLMLAGIGFIATCFCAAVLWFNNTMNPQYIAATCERRTESGVDPEVVRAWATNLLKQYAVGSTNYMGPFDPPVNLCGIWKRSRPSAFIRGGYDYEEPYMFVVWGAAAGHWGLSVGSPTFVPPDASQGDRLWRRGIYFWRQPH